MGKYPKESYAVVSATRHLGNGGCVCGNGTYALGNPFASYFLQKYKTPLTQNRISKYNAGQYIRNGTPESSDISK